MATDSTLSPRQQLMLYLADDLNVQGWDQRKKLWMLSGDPGDEWLNFVGDFQGPAEDHLLSIMNDKPTGHGVLVASEGWDYPTEVKAQLNGDDALRALWRSVAPDKHPKRVEIRHLLLAVEDGEVLGLTVTRESVPRITWARLDSNTPSPVGDPVVDTARALLGLYTQLAERVSEINTVHTLANALEKAMTAQGSEEEIMRQLFLDLPDAIREQIVKGMPDDVREVVRRSLTEEERRRYGL